MPVRIKILLVLHAIALPVAVVVPNIYPPSSNRAFIPVLSLVLSEAGLFGLWGAVEISPRWCRQSGAILATVYLSLALPTAERRWGFENLALSGTLAFLPMMAVFLTFCILRIKGILLLTRSRPQASPKSVQFSIAHIFVVTAVIGVLLTMREALMYLHPDINLIVTVAAYSAVIEVTTFWGALGGKPPLVRLLITVSAASLLGLAVPTLMVSGIEQNTFWPVALGCQALITLATLLVFRSSGWRLCRMAASHQQAPVEDAGSDEAPQSAALCDR